MNPPQANSLNPPPPANDAAAQAPPDQDSDMPAAALTPSIVGNIPVHSRSGQVPAMSEDSELDKIMQDVGKELKKDDKQPAKKHLFGKRHNHKDEVKFSAQPRPVVQVKAPAPQPHQPVLKDQPVHNPQPQIAPRSPAQGPKTNAQPKARKQSSAPVLVIFVAVIVTGALITAAVAAYK